jgi:hypothetical protein
MHVLRLGKDKARSTSWRTRGLLVVALALATSVVFLITPGLASSAIAQRGAATIANANATTLSIAKPTGVVAGDLMIAQITERGGNATDFANLSGWTSVTAGTDFEGGGAHHRVALLYRVATSADSSVSSYTFSLVSSGGGVNASGAIVAFSGVDTSNPFDVTPGSYTAHTASATAISGVTSITTASANAVVLMFTGGWENNTTSSYSTTSPGALTQLYGTVSDGNASVGAAWATKATAGSTGTGSATQTQNHAWGAILIALRPVATADATQSTLTPTSSSITADGSSTQVLTVQAKNSSGTNLTTGGATVTITKQSGTGSIGAVTDNGNGTYTATVTAPTATGSGVFVATLGGNPVESGGASQTLSTVTYVPGAADATQSTLTPTSASLTADGSSTQVLTVQAKDANGNNETAGGSTVTITKSSGSGSIGSVTDNGNGTYSATVTAPTATGSGVFVATLGGSPVKSGGGSQTTSTVTYTPGAANATQSTLTPTSASITADGSSTQVLTVQAKDVNGNNLTSGGSTVTITKQSGSGSIGAVTDNGNGTYTATVTAPTATGSGVFVATLGGNPVKSGTGSQTTSTITYTPGAANATQSTLTPTSSSITANGTATQVLTVQAKDVNGNNETAGGATVTITKQSGTGTIGSVTDNGNGTYSATVTAPILVGSGVFVATLGGNPVKSGTGSQTLATVTYVPGTADATQSTLTPTSASITADGSSTQVLTVQAKDANGNNLTAGGATVTITKQSGSGTIGSVTDNGNGTYSATVTSPTATGSGVFVATLGGSAVKSGTGSQTASTVAYTPGAANATQSTLTPTSSSITADGSSTQVLTVQAKDVNGNNLTSGGATVTITKQSGSGTIGSVTDNGNGTYSATVTSPTATGSGVFVATLGGNPVKSGTGSQTLATVTYTPGAANAAQSTLTPTSSSITADGSSTQVLTVQAKDVNGNNLTSGGSTVTITKSSGTGSIGSVTDNGNGTYSATVTSPTATGSGVFVATLGGNPVKSATGSQTLATVTYTPGAANAAQSTLTPTSASITADGSSTQVLTVQAKDVNGNNLTTGGSTVTITKQSGTGTIGSVTDNANGTYMATVTAPTATGSGVFVATLGGNPVKSGTGSQTTATITYTPGTATKLVITSVPPTATVDTNFSVTVQSQDANGNCAPVIANTGISLASDGAGTLSGNTGTIAAGTCSVTLSSVQTTLDETIHLTASRTSGDSLTTSAASSAIVVAKANFATNTAVSINGTPTVDTASTITVGSYTPTPTSRTYQWELCNSSGLSCSNIGGATSSMYTPVPGDVGSTLRVVETVSKAGYNNGSSTSGPSLVIKASFTTNTAVSVSGTPTVGTASAAIAGSYTPTPTSVAYQWELCNSSGASCSNISGATSSSYTPVAGDVGGTLRVVETVSKAGYNDGSSTSGPSAVVIKGSFVLTSAVVINGQPAVGTTSTITNGVYNVTATSRSWQWELCDSSGNNCSNIGGATANTYTPVPGDVGSTLRIVEIVSRAGYNDGTSTSGESAAVVKGDFTTSSAVAINGTPTVDAAATITTGSFSPTPTSTSYQWRLCDSAGNNCSDIGGANSTSYTPLASQAGQTLRVVETVSKTGYNDGISTSASAVVAKASFTTNTAVSVSGTPTVGTAFASVAGSYTPTQSSTTYQWRLCDSSGANCANISGATSSSYTAVAGDVGSTLRVVETVTKAGYNNGGSTSSASAVVVKGSFATTTAVSINGTPKVGTASTLTAGSYTPSPTSTSYQWELCNGSGASCSNVGTTSSTYTPVAGDVGGTLRVIETVSRAGYNNGSSTSAASPLVIQGNFSTTTPVAINGTPTVGTATTVTAGVYSPTPGSSSYQWQKCDSSGASCVNIGGATTNMYTPVSGDFGSTLRVVETVSKAGYNNGSSTSSASSAVKGSFGTTTAVAIVGTPKIGVQGTTTGGTYSPAPTGRSYQWKRCDTTGNNCVVLSGATYNTYTPVAADVGKTLRVVETVTKSGYANGSSTSAASPLVAPGTFVKNTTVAIFGYPKHGVTSSITQGSYTPTPTARTYQWQRCTGTALASCTNISGATAKTYKPVTGDVGKRLRVIETVSAPGYTNLSVTSAASTAVT